MVTLRSFNLGILWQFSLPSPCRSMMQCAASSERSTSLIRFRLNEYMYIVAHFSYANRIHRKHNIWTKSLHWLHTLVFGRHHVTTDNISHSLEFFEFSSLWRKETHYIRSVPKLRLHAKNKTENIDQLHTAHSIPVVLFAFHFLIFLLKVAPKFNQFMSLAFRLKIVIRKFLMRT